ncbi:conserved hypothetical protein [Gloeothece citriformis PCC 7424]|uniref:Uncharacterized protein n=2 Tax=Gloeothece TaxID=28070 RepID=B7KF64_GLOC7|nr:conserved hypothetical protein [Gloeothece citriformis PCC 7424]
MMIQALFDRSVRWGAFTLLSTGLLTLSIPVEPANARNMYDVCLGQLTAVGVRPEQADAACANALIPKELSRCVRRVALSVSVTADAAVDNCFLSRRPVDVANCVVDINNQVALNEGWPTNVEGRVRETFAEPVTSPIIDSDAQLSPSLLVLEACRRSLQPGVYSQCVTGLSRSGGLDTLRESVSTCLGGEVFPPAIFPDFPQNRSR